MLHRGRMRVEKFEIKSIEVLEREDLAILMEAREADTQKIANSITRLRDPHHMLARYLAMGMKHHEAGRKAGYSIGRVQMLLKSPAFQELMAHYRNLVTDGFKEEVEEYVELATGNMLMAERMIAEQLEDAEENDEKVPIATLLKVSRDAADRLGYGKKTTNVNVNVDLASRLERAIQRSGKTIDGEAVPLAPKQLRRI